MGYIHFRDRPLRCRSGNSVGTSLTRQPGRDLNSQMKAVLHRFEYRKLGDFTYHIISDSNDIREYMMKWIMREWESDHNQAPHEHWTVEWMRVLPKMDFILEVLHLEDIH